MPVLKIKNNGVWEQVGGIPDHTHIVDDITDFPTSLPANGGNADTVDGKHASDFASAAEMTTVQNDINDINTMLNGIEIPAALPNPNALTFTGAVNASYDGSSEMSVEIPDVSGKMDKNNPTGTGSFSLNRKAGSAIGDYSHTEGSDNTASGKTSHAEGNNTTASGPSSHAEGWTTKASGSESHAEGSHTTASGIDSHAEGNNTTASGYFSHAEGIDTKASGHFSHAEGFDTKASSSSQHVQGKYNIEDSSNIYADIIGNGTSTTERSNAATVDWSGNAWYAGDVYVGSTSGTNKDEGSKKLATEEYVDNSTASIEIPQSDWNQNDETAPDYVKNRPFYTGDPVETVFVKESTVTFTEQDGMYQAGVPSTFVPTIGETYTVTWDGIDYECTCIESNSIPLLGDINILFGEPNPAGEPFLIGAFNGAELRITTLDTSTSHTISISKTVAALVVKIDEKYLPDTLLSFKPSGKSYLTFSSPSSFTLAVNDSTKHWNGTLEYFASDKTWTVWNGASALSAVADDGEYVLYLRGIGNTVITGNNVNYKWVLDGSHISCIGNIESLLDYATVESGDHPTMAANCYFSMFNGCTSLTQAPALPATTLAASCYSSMFYGCTSLTQAPDLPATKLANYCYQHMFNGCTRLTKAPALPCNRLADKCYQHMFNGCTSLIQAPALPATKLVDNCYAYMFKGCISLTQTPDLPATKLANYCYQHMFNGCTRLTKAPALPATTLVANCYTYMFYDCRSLTQAPALPATALAASCYANMFRGCSSLKFSSTQIGEYTQEYRIPSSGEGATATDALTNMFTSTGGTFTGTPSINTTYYLSSDNMIVRETDIATLNGYVGSMIDAAVDIPTTLPNPNALTFTGAAEGTYDGSSALTVEIPSTPEIPAALPNPQSLTFTGGVNASYDGSSEVSVGIPDALSDLSEDATHRVVTDAEKAKWNAKSNFSGSYNDLTDKPTIPDVPVQSVNGKTGAVVLSAEDVGALPGSTVIPEALPNPNAITFTGAVEGTYDGSNPMTVEIPSAPTVPENISAFKNDVGYLTKHQDISGKIDNPASGVVGQVLAVKTVDENGKPTEFDCVNQTGGVTIPIVDSVDEMVDTSKQYILKSTGTIWAYKSSATEQEVTVTDELDDTTYYDNSRLASSATGLTDGFHNDATGYHITPLIDLTKAEYQGKTIQIHFEGAKYITSATETWIQHRYYKTDGSVLYARGYSSPSDSGSVGAWKNATITINSETSATIEIAMPLLCGAANVQCGYLRFCGKGAVAGSHIYITYKETQTVISEQWVDTGIQYGGGGLDAETAAKISALNNEGNSPSTIKLLPKPVLDFYNAAAYSDSDYSYSHLEKITYPCRADIPVPYTVKWNYNESAMRTTVAVDTRAIGTVNAYTLRTYDATGLNKFPIYNLLPNKKYYYKVTHIMSDGSLVEAKSGSFTTSSEPWRLLYIDGTQNVRDLGGWTGLNGKKVKYGKIIRGAALSDSSSANMIVTGKGRLALGELKIQAELNLGAIDNATSIAANCAYKKIGYTNYAIAITGEAYRAQFKEVLEWIVSCLDGTLNVSGLYQVQRNIYMHCQGGCDRTGTLSFQLLGLLGVSESDLAKEYELSSFSDVGFGRLRTTTKAVDTYDYVGMVEALKTYSGDTITDKFVSFALDCGISNDTITRFRNLMLE